MLQDSHNSPHLFFLNELLLETLSGLEAGQI